MKLEFVPATATPAFFIVAEQISQAFINHLKANDVYVQPPRHYLTNGGVEYFTLEVQSGIPPQDGNQIVAAFQAQSKKSAEIKDKVKKYLKG